MPQVRSILDPSGLDLVSVYRRSRFLIFRVEQQRTKPNIQAAITPKTNSTIGHQAKVNHTSKSNHDA